jgi:peptide subunit release factor 1 (eRF1)
MLRTFSFDDEKDKDVLDYLDSLAKSGGASKFVRDAIRQAMQDERVTLATILEELREIKRSRNGFSFQYENELAQDEPEDIAASLDALGL